MHPASAEDISGAIKTLLRTAWADIKPEEINKGNCAEFAEEVCRLLANAELKAYWGWIPDMAHAAVRLGNKWFDAECPHGAPAKELPFWAREIVHWDHIPGRALRASG